MSSVDFGRTAEDCSRHRAGFPSALPDHLVGRRIGRPGQDVVDLDVPCPPAARVGRSRAGAGLAATLDALAVAAFSAELTALLAARYPADPLGIPHRIWAVTAQKSP